MTTDKRRFIAGAHCPSCQAQDKLVRVETVAGAIYVECVACGMKRDLNDPPPVEHPVAPSSSEGAVRWMAPPPKQPS